MDSQEKEENVKDDLEGKNLKITVPFENQSVYQQVQNGITPILRNIDSIKYIQENSKIIANTMRPMLQAQAGIKEMLEKCSQSSAVSIATLIQNQMKKIADALKELYSTYSVVSEFSDSVHRMMSDIAEVVQQIKIPSISEERKQELIERYQIWGSYGWTINPCRNINVFNDYVPADKKTADSVALKRCSDQNMEYIFEITEKNKRVKKTDFSEAIFDYKQKQYKSCALVLFSLIDAILIKLQKPSSLKGRRRKVGLNAVNEARKRTKDDLNTELLFTAMFYMNLFACLEKVFEGGKDFKTQPAVINRNFLDHGMLRRKVTRKDCVQLFLLYYNMLELLDMIHK